MTYEDVEQADGSIKRNYSLISGDSFNASIAIKNNNRRIGTDKVARVIFKISDKSYKQKFSQDFLFNEENKLWELLVSGENIRAIGAGRYIYEYEVTFVGNVVNTIMQASFRITNEITA